MRDKKRSIMTIKQYDYTSIEAFIKDKEVMKAKGYTYIEENNSGFDKSFQLHEVDDDIWKYSACFYKSNLC